MLQPSKQYLACCLLAPENHSLFQVSGNRHLQLRRLRPLNSSTQNTINGPNVSVRTACLLLRIHVPNWVLPRVRLFPCRPSHIPSLGGILEENRFAENHRVSHLQQRDQHCTPATLVLWVKGTAESLARDDHGDSHREGLMAEGAHPSLPKRHRPGRYTGPGGSAVMTRRQLMSEQLGIAEALFCSAEY